MARAHYKKIIVNGKRIDEHRHKMQINLGRKLGFNEIVHHKDEDKINNSDGNFELMSRSDHSRLHAKNRTYGKEFSDKMREIGIITMPNKKLEESDVKQIKELIAQKVRKPFIASRFRVGLRTIQDIAAGNTWKHVKS